MLMWTLHTVENISYNNSNTTYFPSFGVGEFRLYIRMFLTYLLLLLVV